MLEIGPYGRLKAFLIAHLQAAYRLKRSIHVYRLQGALVKGEGKNTDTDQSQSTQGRDSLDQQVADYKSSSCSRKPISGIQSSQSRTPPDESHKKKRPGSTSWQSPDKKGIGRNRMKDSSGSSSSKQNAKAAPVAEGLTSSDPGSPLYENEAISASERSLQVISTLDHSDQDHMCPEFLLEDPEQHHIDSGAHQDMCQEYLFNCVHIYLGFQVHTSESLHRSCTDE